MTSLRRRSSSDGAALCDGVVGMKGPPPTRYPIEGGDGDPEVVLCWVIKDSAIGERLGCWLAGGCSAELGFAYGWLLPVDGLTGSLFDGLTPIGELSPKEPFLPWTGLLMARGVRECWRGDVDRSVGFAFPAMPERELFD